MERLEYFCKVMGVVTDLMDVTAQDILGKSRRAEVVDARWMVICLMKEKGYSTKDVAPLLNHPIRTINHGMRSFSDRVKYSNSGIGNIFSIARQQLKD